MTKYYTGRGDDGTTGILSGKRVSKADKLIEAIGNLDELNSAIGVAMSHTDDELVSGELRAIQNDIFVLGANLASSSNEKKTDKAQMKPDSLGRLETSIKALGGEMPELKQFVLPGGSVASSHLHLARAMARRSERSVIAASSENKVDGNVIAYLNRLSSYLFVAALYLNFKKGVEEGHPSY